LGRRCHQAVEMEKEIIEGSMRAGATSSQKMREFPL